MNKDDFFAASPITAKTGTDLYKPESETLTKLLRNEEFKDCPRLRAFRDHLESQSRQKRIWDF